MRVRGAGGLLVGIILYPVMSIVEAASYAEAGFGDTLEAIFWPEMGDRPTNTALVLVVRGTLIVGGLVAGVLAIAGVRYMQIPVAIASAGIAVGLLPWVIWDFNQRSFEDLPPDWVFENPLWFNLTRPSAAVWLVVCGAAFVLALSDLGNTAASQTSLGSPVYAPQSAPPSPFPGIEPPPRIVGPPPASPPPPSPPPSGSAPEPPRFLPGPPPPS